eukprot:TRINITY_DN8535_c0_g1_i1.p1 TRINITY_DN8535_c0_g1~~TRINITY_DN8535_c0_g1_i1.p1  ORF type:complete len:265 (+),score=34.68 TRINITY_DN8535_c0_g1_i1:43-837(+)
MCIRDSQNSLLASPSFKTCLLFLEREKMSAQGFLRSLENGRIENRGAGIMLGKQDWHGAENTTGTSIIAVEYKDGVIVGADSRTTAGAYVSNRVTDKLTKVQDNIYCCRSGSAADTQAIADYVGYYLDLHSAEIGGQARVDAAANLFRQFCYTYKNKFSASIIVGGYDAVNGGQVYSIPLGGVMERQAFAVGGSGSSYIYGWCDGNFKEGMTKEEALAFVRSSLSLAMTRDGSSGGVIRTVCITKDGVERKMICGEEIPRFYEG